jgi:hypothetical protein
MSVKLTDMKINSREFQRDFARMKAVASTGELITISSGSKEFVFHAKMTRTWQGSLKGKGKISGSLFSTGLDWEASR